MIVETLAPQDFWGKLDPKTASPTHWHPLVDHCVDVASVARQLLDLDVWQSRFAGLGLPVREASGRDAVSVLVGLHDLGKFSPGFQRAREGVKPSSHVQAGLQVVAPATREAPDVVVQLRHTVHGVVPEEVWPWLAATICHHGRPGEPGDPFGPAGWSQPGALDVVREVQRLLDVLMARFPGVGEGFGEWPDLGRGRTTRPDHALCGLTVLSDWIGSNRHWFPYRAERSEDRVQFARAAAAGAVRDLGLQPARVERDPTFRDLFPNFDPVGLQRAVGSLKLPDGPSVTVFEAATGSGKTEASLHWFARLHAAGLVDGLYFALPMRTAAIQLQQRVSEAIRTLLGEDGPGTVLAVPGYYQVDDWIGERLGAFEIQWERADRGRVWAAESPKQYLAAPVAVGTVDQVLLGALQTKWAHFRGTCVLRQLLVVDEVHASDAYMARLLLEVVRRQIDAGGHVLLLSATLGSRLRDRLLRARVPSRRMESDDLDSALARPYPCVWTSDGRESAHVPVSGSSTEKRVALECVRTTDPIQEMQSRAVEAVRGGARVLIIRNTVREAVELQEALERVLVPEQLLNVEGVPAPHHSRFAGTDRKRLDMALLAALGRAENLADRRPVVAVATQTAEQSLDLDADLLITDLCPMDVLLQRIGRLHRHRADRAPGFGSARCVVLAPEGSMLDGKRARRHGIGTVYDDLPVLEATRQLVERDPNWVLPRDNRALVERATHPDVLADIATASEGMASAWLDKRGSRSAERNAANQNLCDWSGVFLRPFPRPAPPTRLGEDAVQCQLSRPIRSPFAAGERIWKLDVPRWMLGDALPDEPTLEVSGGTLTDPVSAHEFTYDRCGLRRIDG